MENSSDSRNRVEEAVTPRIMEEDWPGVERALEALDPGDLDPAEKESWYRFRGVAAFRLGRREEAFERFREGAAACPDSVEIRFSLAQEHERRGEPEEMFALLDGMRFPELPAPFALAAARFAYLWEDPVRGAAYVEPLLGAHQELGSLEEARLMEAGLPAFPMSWNSFLVFAHERGELAQARDRLQELAGALGEEALAGELRFLDAWIAGDFAPVLEALEAEPEAERSAFRHLQRALLRARAAEDGAESARLLAEVRVDDPAMPWLEDARLLATCALVAEHGEEASLEQLVAQFLSRQPFLLEPAWLVELQLLDAQLGLREAYRQRRIAAGGVA